MQKSLFPKLFILLVTVNISCFSTSLHAQKKSTIISTDNKITEKVLQNILDQNKHFATQGKVADYIPELGKMSVDAIAFSVVDTNGKVFSVGDTDKKFTIQSISKIVALMVAVREKGEAAVFENMGYYGSDKPFNHFGNLEIT
ncbi:MAG TPA: glutaminase, partial [Flavobacterium sp.]|nr:glutaminase [Flavobacterium sp.]